MIITEVVDGHVVWRVDLRNEGDRQRLLDRLNATLPGTFEFAHADLLDACTKEGA